MSNNHSNNSLNDKLIELAKSGHTDAVELCLKLGVDIHALEDHSLRWASHNGHTDTVRLLLDKGANKDKALAWLKRNNRTQAYKTLKGMK